MSTLTSLELILYNEVTGGHKMKEENKKTGWERQVEAKDSGEKKHPTVICDNLRLIVGLGQWLEVLPAKRKQRKYGMLTNTDLSVQEILRMKHISNGKKEMINRKFSEILSLLVLITMKHAYLVGMMNIINRLIVILYVLILMPE